jgi:CRP/FNR family transcriptional regulator
MSRLPTDALSLAIILRLHAGPCALAELARDLQAASGQISARLSQLSAAGIIRAVSGSPGSSTAHYELVPDGFRSVPLMQKPACPVTEIGAETLRQRVNLLGQCSLFSALSNLELVDLARQSKSRSYGPGEVLFFEGEECHGISVVESGLVRIFKQVSGAPIGGREQTVRLVAPGGSFNEVPVFDGGPNPASAEAMEESLVLLVPTASVRRLIADDSRFAEALLADLAGRVRHMLALVEDLSMRQVASRVAKILLQSIEPIEGVGAGVGRRQRLTQREIADMAGTAREVVARALKDLERQGAITAERGRITIVDPAKLEAML